MTLPTLTLATVGLTWIMILVAAQLRTRGDLQLSTGNRDDLPAASPLAARADRAAKNMLENLILFLAVAFAVAGRNPARVELGALVFLLARLVYWPVYLAGIPKLRTLVWSAGIVGLFLMASAAL